jgi:hypothetical protein
MSQHTNKIKKWSNSVGLLGEIPNISGVQENTISIKMYSFIRKNSSFFLGTKSISTDMSVCFYHSVTGYLGSIFVSSKRLSNGLRTSATNKIRKELIGCYLPFWGKQQCRIDCVLKRSNHRLFSPWHTIEVQSFLVNFAFSVKIFLGSFFEEASLIHDSHLKKRLKTL